MIERIVDTNLAEHEELVEHMRERGKVPVAMNLGSDVFGGDPIEFIDWDEIVDGKNAPMPEAGYVVESGGNGKIISRDSKGNRYRLARVPYVSGSRDNGFPETINPLESRNVNYEWAWLLEPPMGQRRVA